MTERLELKSPPFWKRVLEDHFGIEIAPEDITPTGEAYRKLVKKYPDLLGDTTAIGPGDDGNCQSWRGHKGWWREFVKTQ